MKLLVLVVTLAIVLITVVTVYLSVRREEQAAAAPAPDDEHRALATLHPIIDLERCIGSTACIDACPEALLRVARGRTLIEDPGSCVGHGRCKDVCPVDAIRLVFGSAERGVDLPLLRAGYETNVDGVFVAGELGGMGLIRNAFRQGIGAVASVPRALARPGVAAASGLDVVDVVIVGAGPAGLAAALSCIERELTYVLLEQYSLGGSVAHFPRRKLVLTEPVKLPIVGKVGQGEISKEALMAELERVVSVAGIEVRAGRRVNGITGQAGAFHVTCELAPGRTEVHRGRTVILAIGRRGTPRTLGVPGEDLPHVVYRLVDPALYRDRRVLCVGGGDSAVEAAVALARVAGCRVHLSYRGDELARIKRKNRHALDEAVRAGRIELHLRTQVQRIARGEAILAGPGGAQALEVDDVIVNVGGVLATAFLESIGVEVRTSFGDDATSGPGA